MNHDRNTIREDAMIAQELNNNFFHRYISLVMELFNR